MSTFDPRVRIGSLTMTNPVGVASGTFGYGSEYEQLIDLSSLGALYTKAVTLEPRPGNNIPRIVETPAGMLNSIGLANVGSRGFTREKYPYLRDLPCSVIVNLAGSYIEDYCQTLEYLEEHAPLAGYEVNLSCPNVKCGGMALGTDPAQVAEVTRELRKRTKKPLIIKLSPNVTDITSIAKAAEEAGADAVSCINTLVGMLIDTKHKRPLLSTGTGGLSGPAILPVGLAAVYRVSQAVSIPVIGLGGIMEADHAIQYLLAGASAIQVGTANFVDPSATARILEGITDYARREGLASIQDFHQFLGRKAQL
ncbi:dihydroorotate dehydrogenase [Spirochaeta lutea]|uniref:Dihydroorotate dehydrogenase n=1 Tax=Spirochaeta lutea TaxID=1480694 RepID=A0A098QY79_9SPIO|nr:dihydroorotate dehydrogenase [Spirochaeta lutea]KGE71447.1 dihydroorotate dehydrogenase [Spirochaeta lutea]